MKLSIIIPVFNGEQYLNDCIQSILEELTENIEILLLDDGSKDNSYNLMKKFQRENIRIFQHSNHGVSYTRNRGIKEAKGEYLMFVDADDCLCKGWSKIVLNEIEKNKDIYYFSKDCEDEYIDKEIIIENLFVVKTDYKIKNLPAPWSKLFKRKFLMENRIDFDERLINGEDAIFNLKCITNTDSYMCVRKSFYRYRIYNGSSTKKFNKKFFDANLYFLKIAKECMEKGKIEIQKQNRYLSNSIVYSTYLYLFLISKITDKELKNNALRRFYEKEMQQYMHMYRNSKDCSFVVNCIYFFVKKRMYSIALELIKLRNLLKLKKSNSVIWEEN